MKALAMRNLKVFFRDRTAVFFSLLSAMIIIGLYVLFLGDMMVKNFPDTPGIRFIMDSWIMAGVLAVTSVTTTMGAFGVMVDDRTRKILKDYSASPLSRKGLAGGYVASAYIIGLIVSLITLVLAELYILAYGGSLLPLDALLKLLACLLLSVLTGTAMVFFLASLIQSQSAFSTASSIIGTLIGFLTGVYMPVGVLPTPVQAVVKLFPVSHAGALMRQIMMEAPLQQSLAAMPPEMSQAFRQELSKEMGIVFSWGNFTVTWWHSALYLLATTLVFYGLSVWSVSRKRR